MLKSDRAYKIFMTAIVVIIAGLLLATGIIAIQKSMKMNLSFEANPNYLFEVYIQKSGEQSRNLVFRNFEKSASEGVVMENGFSTLYGNTLSADDSFFETYGSDFEFIIENYTQNSGMRVSVTATAETEGGHEGVLPTITEDKMTATKLKDGSTADYIRFSVTTTEVVFPQTTVLNIVFSEYNEYAVGVSPSSGNFTYTANPVAIGGKNYTANIKAKTGYNLSITVTRGDGTTKTLTEGQGNDYVWDSSTGALTIYAKAVTGDITINCLNNNAITYTISYDLAGGSVATANPTAYTVEDTFTLTNPTKTGYNFAGWTGTGLNSATTSVTIHKGSTGNRTYTATWKAQGYTITYTSNGNGAQATDVPTSPVTEATITLSSSTSGYSSSIPTVTGECTYTYNVVSGELVFTNITSNIEVSSKGLPWQYHTYGSGEAFEGYTYIKFATGDSGEWVIIGSGDNLTSSLFDSSKISGFGGTEYTYTKDSTDYTLIGPNPNPTDKSTNASNGSKELADNQILLLRRQMLSATQAFDADTTYYGNWGNSTDCDIRIYLNSTWTDLSTGDINYKDYMATPGLYTAWATTENSNDGCTYDSDSKIFLLGSRYGFAYSGTLPNESGQTHDTTTYARYHTQNFLIEDYLGTYLSYTAASNPRIFTYDTTTSSYWWLRSGNYSSSTVAYFVHSNGYVTNFSVNLSYGVRPSFILNLA